MDAVVGIGSTPRARHSEQLARPAACPQECYGPKTDLSPGRQEGQQHPCPLRLLKDRRGLQNAAITGGAIPPDPRQLARWPTVAEARWLGEGGQELVLVAQDPTPPMAPTSEPKLSICELLDRLNRVERNHAGSASVRLPRARITDEFIAAPSERWCHIWIYCPSALQRPHSEGDRPPGDRAVSETPLPGCCQRARHLHAPPSCRLQRETRGRVHRQQAVPLLCGRQSSSIWSCFCLQPEDAVTCLPGSRCGGGKQRRRADTICASRRDQRQGLSPKN